MGEGKASLEAPAPPATAGTGMSDLAKRLASAVVLGAIAFSLTWLGVKPFALLVVAFALVISWEWASLVRSSEFDAALVLQGLAVVFAVALAAYEYAALGLAAILCGAIIVATLAVGRRPVLSAAGVLFAGVPAVGLLWFRADPSLGLHAVVFVLCVVIATDTFAYFAGRLIGGPKLAVSVSPNKTWAGLIGGVSAAAMTGGLIAWWIGAPTARLVGIAALLGLAAQAGDLAESALKRSFGVKDASKLLPGHGGFMDRIDGLVAAAGVAALVALATNPRIPAVALLFGR